MSAGAARVSWDTVVTMDFMATIMDVLGVDRPDNQTSWAFDGVSVVPILKGRTPAERGIGWQYSSWPDGNHGYRYGKWKYVHGSTSCKGDDCKGDMLFDLEADLSEKNDISADHPDVFAAIKANFTVWHTSVQQSRDSESLCGGHKPPSPPKPPGPPTPPPAPYAPSSDCDWHNNTGLDGSDIDHIPVTTKEECCGHCKARKGCAAADFVCASENVPKATGVFILPDDLRSIKGCTCHIKNEYSPKTRNDGSIACVPKKMQE
jgi:hypothetical protein